MIISGQSIADGMDFCVRRNDKGNTEIAGVC